MIDFKLILHIFAGIFLLSCRSESTTSENIVWRCSYEGQTSTGRILSAQWVASEHRCWWDGGGERRPKTAEKFGNCGASLYGKEPFFLETQQLKHQSPMSFDCNFTLQGESVSLSVSEANEMTVRFMDEMPQTLQCSVSTQSSVSHGNCSSGNSSLQTRSVFKQDVDIFYAGTCSEGVEIKNRADGSTYETSEIDRHYWTYEMSSVSTHGFQDKCLAEGHSFEIKASVQDIEYFEGSCTQKTDGGLVVTISHNDKPLDCPDHFNIFRITTEK